MKFIIFTQKDIDLQRLYPFTLTKNVQELTLGMMSVRQRWEKLLQVPSFDEEDSANYRLKIRKTLNISKLSKNDGAYYIKANLLPSAALLSKIKHLKPGEAIVSNKNEVLAALITQDGIDKAGNLKKPATRIVYHDLMRIEYPWDLFNFNRQVLVYDFSLLTKKRKSVSIESSNYISNKKQIFVEEGAVVHHTFINADDGPVYISKNALVMEGTCIRGPVFIGEGAVVKMGTRIYGATSIGANCVVGGEIKNSILSANSNKGHDGYLGDAVIGEWCNLGAGTSNSNLKNTADNIVVHLQGQKYEAGLKCGVLMGDFVKTAINTSINTGTVIGLGANVFGTGLTPKEIPCFAWGFNGNELFRFDKLIQSLASWKKLKGASLSDEETKMITTIYNNFKKNLK